MKTLPIMQGQLQELAELFVEVPSRAVSLRQGPDLAAVFVDGTYFLKLGIKPLYGRFLADRDDAVSAAPVAVLSHSLWSRFFQSNPRIVGQAIWLNGAGVTVIGIGPRSFPGLQRDETDVWLPLSVRSVLLADDRPFDTRSVVYAHLYGRAKPGVRRQAVIEESQKAWNHLQPAGWTGSVNNEQIDARL